MVMNIIDNDKVTKKELKARICDAFRERLSADGFKFRKWDTTCLREEDADITYLITLYFYGLSSPDYYGLDIICAINFNTLVSLEKDLCNESKPRRAVTGTILDSIINDQMREIGRNKFFINDNEKEFNRKVDLIVDRINKYGIPYLNMLSEKECTIQQMENEGLYSYPQLLPLAYLLWCKDKEKCLDAAKDVLNFYAQYGTDNNEQYKNYLFFYKRLKQYAADYKEM